MLPSLANLRIDEPIGVKEAEQRLEKKQKYGSFVYEGEENEQIKHFDHLFKTKLAITPIAVGPITLDSIEKVIYLDKYPKPQSKTFLKDLPQAGLQLIFKRLLREIYTQVINSVEKESTPQWSNVAEVVRMIQSDALQQSTTEPGGASKKSGASKKVPYDPLAPAQWSRDAVDEFD